LPSECRGRRGARRWCCVASAGPAPSTEPLAQARQHVLAVEFQKARLVWSRRVEHQIAETETDIVTDPLDVLIGVAGYDPSAGGAPPAARGGAARGAPPAL